MTTLPQLTDLEFRSKEEIGGWPLIHINIGTNPETGRPLVAKGVVAIGCVFRPQPRQGVALPKIKGAIPGFEPHLQVCTQRPTGKPR